MMTVVSAYRCGAVPEFHRIPLDTPYWGITSNKTQDIVSDQTVKTPSQRWRSSARRPSASPLNSLISARSQRLLNTLRPSRLARYAHI